MQAYTIPHRIVFLHIIWENIEKYQNNFFLKQIKHSIMWKFKLKVKSSSYLISTIWLFEFKQSSLLYRFPMPQKRLFRAEDCDCCDEVEVEDDSRIHCDHSPFGTLLYSKQGQFSFSDIFRSLLRVSDEGKLLKLNRKRKFLHFILKFWCLFTSFCKLENFCNNLFSV